MKASEVSASERSITRSFVWVGKRYRIVSVVLKTYLLVRTFKVYNSGLFLIYSVVKTIISDACLP